MRQHLGTHRNGKLKVSDIYKIDEDLRGFFLSKVKQINIPLIKSPCEITSQLNKAFISAF